MGFPSKCVAYVDVIFQVRRDRQKVESCWPAELNDVSSENWVLLGYYAASSGNFLPTFWDNVYVPSSVFFFDSWTVRMGPTGCPKTSLRNYNHSLRVITQKSAVLSHLAAEAWNRGYFKWLVNYELKGMRKEWVVVSFEVMSLYLKLTKCLSSLAYVRVGIWTLYLPNTIRYGGMMIVNYVFQYYCFSFSVSPFTTCFMLFILTHTCNPCRHVERFITCWTLPLVFKSLPCV